MKTRRLLTCAAVFAISLAFTSCIAAIFVRYPHHAAFNEAEFAPYGAPGTGSVIGQLICTYENEAHPGQSTPVSLLPVTAYTQEMVDRELGDGVTLTQSDSRLKKYLRITRTDHQGNFSFQQLPAGEYFVAGEASWTYTADDDMYQWACERVTVKKGQTVQIKVTHNPQHGNSPINNIWTLE